MLALKADMCACAAFPGYCFGTFQSLSEPPALFVQSGTVWDAATVHAHVSMLGNKSNVDVQPSCLAEADCCAIDAAPNIFVTGNFSCACATESRDWSTAAFNDHRAPNKDGSCYQFTDQLNKTSCTGCSTTCNSTWLSGVKEQSGSATLYMG